MHTRESEYMMPTNSNNTRQENSTTQSTQGTQEEDEMQYTLDGTVDVKGKPAIRSTTGGFKSAAYILVNQGLVCLALYGISVNLVIYLTDVLREGNSSAAANTSNWQGAQYFFSVIGGFIGDAYLGRYLSGFLFQLVFIAGVVLTALSATLTYLRPPSCQVDSINCKSANGLQIGLFYWAIYMVALGSGCYQPNIISFGADQFDEQNPVETIQKVQFFNWFYIALTLGTLTASTGLVYIENEGKWALGFWISCGAGVLALITFLAPTSRYRFHKAAGNPLSRIAQVIVAAIRKRKVKLDTDNNLYEVADSESAIKGSRKIIHTDNLRFFDRAAIITEADIDKSDTRGPKIIQNTWQLCTVTQVEEVKWLCRMIPIWVFTIFYTTAYTQVYSLFVIQGAAMDTQLGTFNIPPAGLYAVDCITVVLSITAYTYWLMPLARQLTGTEEGLTGLQRIGLGMPIVALAMLFAGFVETARLKHVHSGGNISILWQLPLYISTGISETFTYIGMMHFFYDQAPDAIRSIGSALPQASVALGSYVNSLLVIIVSKLTGYPGWIPDSDTIDSGHLDYFFYLLSILTLVNFGLFFLSSIHYKHTDRQDLSPASQALPLFSSAGVINQDDLLDH